MAHPGGRPRKWKTEDADEFANQVDLYLEDDANSPWTVSGLALYLGIINDTLYEYEKRPEFSDSIKKARQFILNFAERRLFQPVNNGGVMFSLKNNFKWADRMETDNKNETKTTAALDDDAKKVLEEILQRIAK